MTVWADDRPGGLVPGSPGASEAEPAMGAALFGTSTAVVVLVGGGLVRELRTPLTAIQGYAELALRPEARPERQ